jgi:octanoyl-[GcvH]:protein N-octanoyltransferase
VRLVESHCAGEPVLDTALSRALLQRVSEGRHPEVLRLHRTDDVMAFSVLDRTRPGFHRAVAAARASGFTPVLRLAGGRAAAFHDATLAFGWSRPVTELHAGIHERFREVADVLRTALRSLGADARIGEVPGEYCPGEYSINAGGRVKLAGIGQRVIRGAAHVGGVVVVDGTGRMREAIEPVYRALDYPFEPASVGSLQDEVGKCSLEDAADAIRRALSRLLELEPVEPEAEALALARELSPAHHLA